MDFTLKTYQTLLKTLLERSYNFQTFQEFIKKPESKSIILRHDVDKLSENSLRFAQIQHELGIKGSYYFRIVPQSFEPKIIEDKSLTAVLTAEDKGKRKKIKGEKETGRK